MAFLGATISPLIIPEDELAVKQSGEKWSNYQCWLT